MNKARDLGEWKQAMRMQAIPMFNTVYADREHILYVYNALLPVRPGGRDWQAVLPGNESALVWKDYVPFDSLPQVEDPRSGFVQTCSSAPWNTTTGEGNPRSAAFDANLGIETNLTNRALRSLALLGTDAPVTRDQFFQLKWDRSYDARSEIVHRVVAPLREVASADANEREALGVLNAWNFVTDESSVGATLAILTWRGVDPDHAGGTAKPTDVVNAFRSAVKWLMLNFGSVRVPWGDVQRLRRGSVDLALGGGPDVLNGINAATVDGHLVGRQGDSLVVIAEFREDGVNSSSIHQYGASSRPASPHYADQAPLFVKRGMKPTWRTPESLEGHVERAYHPGE